MKQPYYKVTVTTGKAIGEKQFEEVIFADEALAICREKALAFAFPKEQEVRESADSPELVNDIPEIISMLNSGGLTVEFCVDDFNQFTIYGETIHEVLSGLSGEAFYYQRNGLIEKNKLIQVLQNTDEDDEENPPFELATFVTEMPEWNYAVIEVLPTKLDDIIRETCRPDAPY